MLVVIAKIVSGMQVVYVGWNAFCWNYHINRARLHDDRISQLNPEWRNELQCTSKNHQIGTGRSELNESLGRKVILEFDVEEVRKMIGILLHFQADHQDNNSVETLLEHLTEQFDDFGKENNR